MHGRYRFTYLKNGKVTGHSPWIKNLIMKGDTNGTGLITRLMNGDISHPLTITHAAIGTGSTPPSVSDTALEALVLDNIPIRTKSRTPTSFEMSFFVPDIDLPNGTYREFALYCGDDQFARSLILPVYVKGTGQDAIITYEVTID